MDDQKPNVLKYNRSFYHDGGNLAFSAASLVLREISSFLRFHSFVDFGCGAGGWLRAASDIMNQFDLSPRILGIEGPYAKSFAKCEGAEFIFQDLEKRIDLPSKFDLAISMEVAEHLTAGRARTFVDDLCKASDVVLFSAAVPGQGGTNHINEQWQSYWIELFGENSYRCFDILRPVFWNDESFFNCPFYVANGFLFVRAEQPLTALLSHREITTSSLVDVVHPQLFLQHQVENLSARDLARQLPKLIKQLPIAAIRSLRRRLS